MICCYVYGQQPAKVATIETLACRVLNAKLGFPISCGRSAAVKCPLSGIPARF